MNECSVHCSLRRRDVCAHQPHHQHGSALLEALIGMLIFMIGMLGMIAAQTTGNRIVMDAQFRVEAAAAADDLIARIKTADPAQREAQFATDAAGFTTWLDERVKGNGRGLPGASATVEFGETGSAWADPRLVRITVSWTTPGTRNDTGNALQQSENKARSHVTLAAVYE